MRPLAAPITAMLLMAACANTVTGSTSSSTSATTTTRPATSTSVAALDSRAIYQLVSPSLVYVEGALGTGSGIVIDERHVITNLHVIWPATTATVLFTNGTEIKDAPVTGVDWMADLAIIEVDTGEPIPPPLPLAGSTNFPIGSEVYLVGYPADATVDPTPAITAGVLSRTRKWAEADLTFIQSDASISGGQSGGALVSETGEVIGISGLSLGDGGLALSLSSPDITKLISQMLAGNDQWGLGPRFLADLRGEPAHTAFLPNFAAEMVFVFEGAIGDDVAFTIESDRPASAYLLAPDGYLEATLDDTDEENLIEAELSVDGLWFLSVVPIIDYDVSIEVITDVELRAMTDPDHGRSLTFGDAYAGNTDYPGDFDWFEIELDEGDEVSMRVTSSNMDAGIAVDWVGNTEEDWVAIDSDSGGGVLGYDAEIEFTAPVGGTYIVSVVDESSYGPGGYLIEVSRR